MISSVLINKKFNKETMNIEEKAKEILRSKLTDIDLECYLKGSPLTYNACLEAVKEAINYTHSCETLPDRALNISQEAFINNCQDYFGGKPK
jgi:hypothetical protein